MAKLTYVPRSPYATPALGLGTPEGSLLLESGVSKVVTDKIVKFLQDNNEEFKSCVEMKIIIVEGYTEPQQEKPPEEEPPKEEKKTSLFKK